MRALLLLAAVACAPPPGHPPVARIDVRPRYVPENDGFATAVTLDGARSCDEIDRPETCLGPDAGIPRRVEGLTFAWSIDEGARLVNAEAPIATAHVRGDRPVEVRLTVTDADGLEASARRIIGVTLPP